MEGGPSSRQRKSFNREIETGKHVAYLGNGEELGCLSRGMMNQDPWYVLEASSYGV